MSLIVLKKIIEMFIILLVGVIIYKAKIINDVSTKHLSNVLLLLVSPLLIIQSYQIDFNRELLQGLIWAFAASFTLGVAGFFSYVFVYDCCIGVSMPRG